jgi:hypothetical protein
LDCSSQEDRKMNFDVDYLESACNTIDATMFSGDAFLSEENRNALRFYIGRWEREMKRIDEEPEDVD